MFCCCCSTDCDHPGCRRQCLSSVAEHTTWVAVTGERCCAAGRCAYDDVHKGVFAGPFSALLLFETPVATVLCHRETNWDRSHFTQYEMSTLSCQYIHNTSGGRSACSSECPNVSGHSCMGRVVIATPTRMLCPHDVKRASRVEIKLDAVQAVARQYVSSVVLPECVFHKPRDAGSYSAGLAESEECEQASGLTPDSIFSKSPYSVHLSTFVFHLKCGHHLKQHLP